MTLEDEVSLLDPFTHTEQDREKILYFDFIGGKSSREREKVMIDQTFCTLITVGGKFLEKKAFKMVLKKVDEIRRIFRILHTINNYDYNYPINFFFIKQ